MKRLDCGKAVRPCIGMETPLLRRLERSDRVCERADQAALPLVLRDVTHRPVERAVLAELWRDRFAEVPFGDKGGSHPGRYYQDIAIEQKQSIEKHGQDLPEIRQWKRSAAKTI